MYRWEMQPVTPNQNHDINMLLELHDTILDALGLTDFTLADLRQRLNDCQILGLLKDDDNRICGCVMLYVPETPFEGKYLLWGNGGLLRKSVQKKIVWRQILEKSQEAIPDKTVGWIGCRTQNPLMMRSYGLFGKLYPFQNDYTNPQGQRLMEYMRRHVPQVRDVEDFRPEKGICRGLLHGRLGDYPVNPDGKYEQILASWGFDPDNGDSLVVVAEIQPAEAPKPLRPFVARPTLQSSVTLVGAL